MSCQNHGCSGAVDVSLFHRGKGETYFCYLCGELLASSDHAAHYEGAGTWQCREKVVMKCLKKIPNDAKSLKRFETVEIDLCSGVLWFLSGFEGAIGLRGPFGSVCMNKREPDSSLPSQPLPPRLSVVRGEEEGSIALRITFSDHRRGVFFLVPCE